MRGRTVISAQIASTAGSLTPPAPRQHMLRGLWHGRSIRLQLLVVFIAVDLFAVLLSGTVTIVRARAQTRVEIAASVHLAELLVSDAAKIVSQQLTRRRIFAGAPRHNFVQCATCVSG